MCSQLSAQERIARLAKLKAVSKGLRCGGRGRWAGDPARKFPKQSDKPPGGNAVRDDDSSSEVEDMIVYDCLAVGSQTKKEGTCDMAYKLSPKNKREFDSSERAVMSSGTSSPSSFSLVEANARRSLQKPPPAVRRPRASWIEKFQSLLIFQLQIEKHKLRIEFSIWHHLQNSTENSTDFWIFSIGFSVEKSRSFLKNSYPANYSIPELL